MRHLHPYINAVPLDAHLGRDHWPTDDEYVALHRARDAVAAAGKGASYDVAVMHQFDQYARVFWDGKTGDIGSEIIEYGAPGTRRIVKQWNGVPEKAPMVKNVNKNTVIVNVPGGRQDHAPRHYVNAQPHSEWMDHWPTQEEMESLHEAKRHCDANARRGLTGATNIARVAIRGGMGARASVWRDPPAAYHATIEAPNPTTQTGWMPIKQWFGVPEWAAPCADKVAGGQINVHAPGPQVHRVPHDTHFVHEPRIHHHWQAPEHFHHGAPPSLDIAVEPARVNVHRGAAVEHRHEPKRGFWGTLLLGPTKQQERPLAHATPTEIDRGALHPIPRAEWTQSDPHLLAAPTASARQEAPLALPAPAKPSLPAGTAGQRQIAHHPENPMPTPMPRKRGLFSWR